MVNSFRLVALALIATASLVDALSLDIGVFCMPKSSVTSTSDRMMDTTGSSRSSTSRGPVAKGRNSHLLYETDIAEEEEISSLGVVLSEKSRPSFARSNSGNSEMSDISDAASESESEFEEVPRYPVSPEDDSPELPDIIIAAGVKQNLVPDEYMCGRDNFVVDFSKDQESIIMGVMDGAGAHVVSSQVSHLLAMELPEHYHSRTEGNALFPLKRADETDQEWAAWPNNGARDVTPKAKSLENGSAKSKSVVAPFAGSRRKRPAGLTMIQVDDDGAEESKAGNEAEYESLDILGPGRSLRYGRHGGSDEGGSTLTATVVQRSEDGMTISSLNQGDSRSIVIRGDQVVFDTRGPDPSDSSYTSAAYFEDESSPSLIGEHYSLVSIKERPASGQFGLAKGDIIIMGSDGLYDNMHDHEIIEIVSEWNDNELSKDSLSALAEKVKGFASSKNNATIRPHNAKKSLRHDDSGRFPGKPDDITVVVARVSE